jgi:hypothetical protein
VELRGGAGLVKVEVEWVLMGGWMQSRGTWKGGAIGWGGEERGGARGSAGRLWGAFRGRARASLAPVAAAAARTALRPPHRRSRGRPVLGRLLGHHHRHPKGSSL